MELGATMEFRVGRGGQLEVGGAPFIVKEEIQPLSTYTSLRHAVLPLQERGTTARPRGTTVRDHGSSAVAAETRTCLTKSSTSASVVLPLPLAVLPQGRKVLAYEGRG